MWGAKSLSRDAVWITADRLMKAIGGFLVTGMVARHLGPSDFGLMSSLLAIASILTPISQLGMANSITKVLADRSENQREFTTTIAVAIALSGFITIPAAILIAPLFLNGSVSDSWVLPLLACLSAPFQWLLVCRAMMEVNGRIAEASRLETLTFALGASIRLILVYSNTDVSSFLIANAIEAIFLAAIYTAKSKAITKFSMPAWRETISRIIPRNWPQIASGFLVMLQARMDIILIGALISQQDLGQYVAALKMPEAAGVTATIIFSLFNVRILMAQNEETKQKYRLMAYRMHLLLGASSGLLIFILGPFFVRLAFGAGFEAASDLIQLLAFRPVLTHLGMAREGYLIREGLLKHSLASLALGVPVFLALALLMIDKYGLTGVVLASYISYLFTYIAVDWWNPNTRNNLVAILFPFGKICQRC